MDALKSKNTNVSTNEQSMEMIAKIQNFILKMLNVTGALEFINKTKKQLEERKLPK